MNSVSILLSPNKISVKVTKYYHPGLSFNSPQIHFYTDSIRYVIALHYCSWGSNHQQILSALIQQKSPVISIALSHFKLKVISDSFIP